MKYLTRNAGDNDTPWLLILCATLSYKRVEHENCATLSYKRVEHENCATLAYKRVEHLIKENGQ